MWNHPLPAAMRGKQEKKCAWTLLNYLICHRLCLAAIRVSRWTEMFFSSLFFSRLTGIHICIAAFKISLNIWRCIWQKYPPRLPKIPLRKKPLIPEKKKIFMERGATPKVPTNFRKEFIAGNRRERGSIAFCLNMELGFFRCFSLVHTHVQKNEIEFSFFSFVFSKNIFPLTSSREGATNISISPCYVKTVKKKLNPNERSFSPFFHIRKH